MSNQNNIVIYTISDPRTNLVRYVGKTIDFNYRCRKHRTERNKTLKAQWMKGIIALGLQPIFEIIDECTEDDWQVKERFYIRFYKMLGAKLLNQLPGGEGGATMKGKKLTIEQANKITLSKIGKPNPATAKYNTINKGNKVNRFTMDGIFIQQHPSITQAGKDVGRSPRRIWMMVNGDPVVKNVAGYIFKKAI